MRRVVAVPVTLLVACAPQSSESWRECDAAFEMLSRPRAPTEYASIVPVEVGDPLPTVRITGHAPDADAVANRALATACVLTDGEVRATQALPRWAEAVLAGELFPDVGQVFDPPVDLHSLASGTVALDVDVLRESDVAPPEPSPGEVDAGVGSAAAQAVADTALGRLVEHELLADTELRLSSASEWHTAVCDAGTETCTEYVERYSFAFLPHVAGAPVLGSWAEIHVDREGTLVGLRVSTVDIESAGMTIAAIDEAQAELRFLELAQAQIPTREVVIHTPGKVAFVVPQPNDPADAEAVWYGAWITAPVAGVGGSPQPSWLSLSDANAPLVPLGP